MKKERRQSAFWFLIALGFIILMMLMLLSSVLDVGERLVLIHPYLAYGFYGLTALLIYLLLLKPVYSITIRQTFSIATSLEEGKNLRLLRRVSKTLQNASYVTPDEKQRLSVHTGDQKLLIETLSKVFQGSVKKEMMHIMQHHAKTVMVSTAISQNGRLDFLTVLIVNMKMIKELVEVCGFRPSYQQLAKLSVQVISTALVAEGLEDLNLQDVLPQSTLNSMSEIPLMKPLLSSFTQGISNALLTLRIGIVTREYLFVSATQLTKTSIRRTAFLEAATMTPKVIAEAIAILPKSIINIFQKPKNKTNQA
jgi:uncharacterized membrane protein YcjF (UPF0283 family)